MPPSPKPETLKTRWVAFLFLCFLPCIPYLTGTPAGGDLDFHVTAWFEIAQQWHFGTLYPLWSPASNYGLGDSRFLFYPPVTWLFGSLLTIFPVDFILPIFGWTALVLSGVTSYRLARRWLSPLSAWTVAVLYALNPYNLISLHYRNALSELFADAVLPLLVLFAIRLLEAPRKNFVPFTCVACLSLLLNIPVFILAVYCLAPVFIFESVRRRNLLPASLFALSLVGSAGLAGFFTLPVWRYRPFAALGVLVDDEPYRASFILTTRLGISISIVVYIAGLILLGIGVVALVKLIRSRDERFGALLPGFVLAFVLAAPLSTVLWRYLPLLKYVQFSNRFLAFVALFDAILLTAYTSARMRMILGLAPALFLLCATFVHYRSQSYPIAQVVADLRSGHGTPGSPEYLPAGISDERLQPVLNAAANISPAESVRYAGFSTPNTASLAVETPASYHVSLPASSSGRAVLPLLCFEGWTIEGTSSATLHRDPATGLCVVQWTGPTQTNELRFKDVFHARRSGAFISLLIAVALFLFHFRWGRGSRAETSTTLA